LYPLYCRLLIGRFECLGVAIVRTCRPVILGDGTYWATRLVTDEKSGTALVVNLMWTPDQPDIHRQCVVNISRLKPECERLGIPLMVEPLSWIPDSKTRADVFNPDLARYTSLVRQAVELGADVVKANPSENLADYPRIIETASGKPVLVRGGSWISDHELLVRTHALMELCAACVVYGRNIYQHSSPEKMLKACNAIVHERAGVTEAETFLTAN
jgi:class I fructose-bisphosphate aldolase